MFIGRQSSVKPRSGQFQESAKRFLLHVHIHRDLQPRNCSQCYEHSKPLPTRSCSAVTTRMFDGSKADKGFGGVCPTQNNKHHPSTDISQVRVNTCLNLLCCGLLRNDILQQSHNRALHDGNTAVADHSIVGNTTKFWSFKTPMVVIESDLGKSAFKPGRWSGVVRMPA